VTSRFSGARNSDRHTHFTGTRRSDWTLSETSSTARAGVAGFIFYNSILTEPPTYVDPAKPDLIPLDKWRHFVAYAGFGGTLAYATADWSLERRYAAVLVIGTTIAYGVRVEFGQSFVPERDFSLVDAYANALGVCLSRRGMFFVRIWSSQGFGSCLASSSDVAVVAGSA